MQSSEDRERRRTHVDHSQAGVVGDGAHIEGGVNFFNIVTSPWVIVLGVMALMLLTTVAFANVSDAREQLFAWLQPRAFPAERDGEVLIVIARFHHTEGVVDSAAHEEIKRAIEREAGKVNLRVEVAPTRLEAADRAGARALGDR